LYQCQKVQTFATADIIAEQSWIGAVAVMGLNHAAISAKRLPGLCSELMAPNRILSYDGPNIAIYHRGDNSPAPAAQRTMAALGINVLIGQIKRQREHATMARQTMFL
jgi:hypothetical protein